MISDSEGSACRVASAPLVMFCTVRSVVESPTRGESTIERNAPLPGRWAGYRVPGVLCAWRGSGWGEDSSIGVCGMVARTPPRERNVMSDEGYADVVTRCAYGGGRRSCP